MKFLVKYWPFITWGFIAVFVLAMWGFPSWALYEDLGLLGILIFPAALIIAYGLLKFISFCIRIENLHQQYKKDKKQEYSPTGKLKK